MEIAFEEIEDSRRFGEFARVASLVMGMRESSTGEKTYVVVKRLRYMLSMPFVATMYVSLYSRTSGKWSERLYGGIVAEGLTPEEMTGDFVSRILRRGGFSCVEEIELEAGIRGVREPGT